jgi:microcystin-dependent protein
MSEPLVGELRIMPYGGTSPSAFIPRGWAPCNGQLLSIAQNTALFSLLGTAYGGDGRTTFALPDLRGRAAMGQGQGPGLSSYRIGSVAGSENVTLQSSQLPAHTHPIGTATVPVGGASTAASPAGAYLGTVSPAAYGTGTSNGPMAAGTISGPTTAIGGDQGHENRQPYLALNYYIATQGMFPQRQ